MLMRVGLMIVSGLQTSDNLQMDAELVKMFGISVSALGGGRGRIWVVMHADIVAGFGNSSFDSWIMGLMVVSVAHKSVDFGC